MLRAPNLALHVRRQVALGIRKTLYPANKAWLLRPLSQYGYGSRKPDVREGGLQWVQGANYMGTEDDLTLGGGHTVQYTDHVSEIYT